MAINQHHSPGIGETGRSPKPTASRPGFFRPLHISTLLPAFSPTAPSKLLPSTRIFKSSRYSVVRERGGMGSASKASLIVAASMGAVEALKDQAGLCRWNYVMRSLNQQAKNSIASFSQARRMSSSSSNVERRKGSEGADDKAKRSEESLRKVMYLSCWGPN